MQRARAVCLSALTFAAAASAASAQNLQFTYLWHLEQPIYWPAQKQGAPDRYEHAWDSLLRGGVHPLNNLTEIFGLEDRKNAYQTRIKETIDDIDWAPFAGAQVSYSGGLIHNVRSLGNANQLGYSPSWYLPKRQARLNLTAGGKPRLDIVLFGFHHPLLPLVDENTVRKEIQLYKAAYPEAWGTAQPMSRGFFPSEMAFSTRLIKPMVEEGVAWTFVSAEKISRANIDFPIIFGSGGVNCDPPNPADQINPAQVNYYRQSISRGCAPAEAIPQSFTPQRARTVDPETGQVYEMIVVPCSQSLGWKDGYAPLGLTDFNAVNAFNNPARPMLVVLSHDGDNAWGGGYSYYREATPNLVSSAVSAGYVPTVVEQYLANHPVPPDAVVHVEDGAWVNADGDFGAPQFINWNWPLINAQGQIDVENGWHVDARNWAVITAAQNRVETAEQIAGGVRIEKILHPDASTTNAERAWHYFLGSLNSGYMYYGSAIDMEVKPALACNAAVARADLVIGDASLDQTPPTIWIPQRHPWNPGAVNFGPQYGYQHVALNSDLWIWSFVYDVSGLQFVTLKYRIDQDGVNPLDSIQNETYAGGPEVGPWISVPMTFRDFPAGNVFNDPDIDFFIMPQYIAPQYHAKLTGLSDVLIDYYIEATDTKGNTKKSPIQHVYIGDGAGSGGPGGGERVSVDPSPAVAGAPVTISYDAAGGPLSGAPAVFAHVGFNQWDSVLSPGPSMTFDGGTGEWIVTVNVPSSAFQLDLAFNNGSGTWDNNNGQDWHFPVTGTTGPAFVMDGALDPDTVLVAENGPLFIRAKLVGDELYLAAPAAGSGNDHFIYLARQPGAMVPANWAKSGQIAQWDAFLGNENDNNYNGWFDASGSNQSAASPGGVLEGTLNLSQQFGGNPDGVWLAVASYATPDAGALHAQSPAPVLANGDIEAGEYIYLDLTQFAAPQPCPGDANDDDVVDFNDITSVLANWLNNYAPDTGPGDANADSVVDFNDITAILANWLTACP